MKKEQKIISIWIYFYRKGTVPEKLKNLQVTKTAAGKPRIAKSDCFISKAHTDNYEIFGLSNADIGIDIERPRLPSHWKKIANRYFSNDIAHKIKSSKAFTIQWTAFESLVKALGIGIAYAPSWTKKTPKISLGKWIFFHGFHIKVIQKHEYLIGISIKDRSKNQKRLYWRQF